MFTNETNELSRHEPMTKKHKPTAKTRKQTEEMAGYGLPHEQIGAVIGIDDKTLRKYYRSELNRGKAIASLAVAKSLFQKATEDKDTTAMIWWTKSQMGWSDKPKESDDEPQSLSITFIAAEPVDQVKTTNARPIQGTGLIEG
jgi:hypothetical protein